jgi:excisionase family DNA binding protein
MATTGIPSTEHAAIAAPPTNQLKGTDESRLLSPREIASRTGLHEEVVRRAFRRGELRGYVLCRRIRFTEADYQDWLKRSLYEAGS